MRKKRRIRAGLLVLSLFIALAVGGAVLAGREIRATLSDIASCRYTLDASEPALSAAFLAAYNYGSGSERYGLARPRAALFRRHWALKESRDVEELTAQPWFDAYRAGLAAFGSSGMPDFLKAFDSTAYQSPRFSHDPLFREFAQSEGYDVDIPRQRRLALDRYFRELGYDKRLREPFIKLNRLLIANFVTPCEAMGGRDSLGMDKLTHYYHARLVAARYGLIPALVEGVGVEVVEFFLGDHHIPVLRAMLETPSHTTLTWANGWPRLYPVKDFYQKYLADFQVGTISYEEWRQQVSGHPFGWGDVVASFTGALSEKLSWIDCALIVVWLLAVMWFAVHIRKRAARD